MQKISTDKNQLKTSNSPLIQILATVDAKRQKLYTVIT